MVNTPAKQTQRTGRRHAPTETLRERLLYLMTDDHPDRGERDISGNTEHEAGKPEPPLGVAVLERLHIVAHRERKLGRSLIA